MEEFDPDNITRDDMSCLADHIEEYLEQLLEVMIIPKEIINECEDEINEGIKRTRKLIKKLRKGDKSVFKDADDCTSIYSE